MGESLKVNESPENILDIRPMHLLQFEFKKNKNKGYWLILAWILASIYFFCYKMILEKIWPENIENPGIFYALTTYLVFNGMLFFVNLEYMCIYKLEHPFFEKYKTTPDAWPWKVDKEKWNKQIKKTLVRVFINNFILLPLFLIPDIISNACPFRLDTQSFPTYLEMISQMAICMLVEDFVFYSSHWLLHRKFFYSRVHKIHHEYVESVCISATYSHYIEYILGNILPSSVAPLLLNNRMHFITYLVYITMVLHESHDGHSGYTFPWSPHRVIPLTFDAEFHIFHHWKYDGNYANYLSIWDRVFGTINKTYKKYYTNKEKFLEEYKSKNDLYEQTVKEKKN
jgi:sterol desaturase/sphingolipid hydroxylase (fatty acid hydroxylase superfamily)